MAHPINDKINILEGRKAVCCNETCKYWRFPHLETACVLSEVFSVKKGEPCYIYEPREKLMRTKPENVKGELWQRSSVSF